MVARVVCRGEAAWVSSSGHQCHRAAWNRAGEWRSQSRGCKMDDLGGNPPNSWGWQRERGGQWVGPCNVGRGLCASGSGGAGPAPLR
jgi:hypothetical protein